MKKECVKPVSRKCTFGVYLFYKFILYYCIASIKIHPKYMLSGVFYTVLLFPPSALEAHMCAGLKKGVMSLGSFYKIATKSNGNACFSFSQVNLRTVMCLN